jgi:hypothetical protein
MICIFFIIHIQRKPYAGPQIHRRFINPIFQHLGISNLFTSNKLNGLSTIGYGSYNNDHDE